MGSLGILLKNISNLLRSYLITYNDVKFMSKIKGNQSAEIPVLLLVPGSEAEDKINDRILKGKALLERKITSEEEVDLMEENYNKWNDFNKELLKSIFTGQRMIEDYMRHISVSYSLDGGASEMLRYYGQIIKGAIRELESIVERLQLFPAGSTKTELSKATKLKADNRKIFIVHGHDDGLKQKVARILEKLKLSPIILHEEANEGKTIIEKLEKHADVGFAAILLTPDDVGRNKKDDSDKPRARQNVVLELGYFIGKLGRKNVCALHARDVELPSDLSGIVYVPIGEDDAWQYTLAREIKVAGIDVDMNLLS